VLPLSESVNVQTMQIGERQAQPTGCVMDAELMEKARAGL